MRDSSDADHRCARRAKGLHVDRCRGPPLQDHRLALRGEPRGNRADEPGRRARHEVIAASDQSCSLVTALYLRQNYRIGAGGIRDYVERSHDIRIAGATVQNILRKHGLGRLPANQKTSVTASGGSATRSPSRALACRWT